MEACNLLLKGSVLVLPQGQGLCSVAVSGHIIITLVNSEKIGYSEGVRISNALWSRGKSTTMELDGTMPGGRQCAYPR